MVRTLADAWPALEGHYRLSWSERRTAVRSLLEKSAITQRCKDTGSACRRRSNSTRTAIRRSRGTARSASHRQTRPPLSSFKVRVIESVEELARLRAQHADALPFIVQAFVPGGDERIRFCALYLDRGQEIARFDGRKLRSRPMVIRPLPNRCTTTRSTPRRRASCGLELSGPVSVEWKLDPGGLPWIIEPTVGRTDFWIDVCVANGVNLPWIEYCHQSGAADPARIAALRPDLDQHRARPRSLAVVGRTGRPATCSCGTADVSLPFGGGPWTGAAGNVARCTAPVASPERATRAAACAVK